MYHCTYRNICQLWLCVATGGRTIYGYIHGSSYQTKSCLINLTIAWWLPDNCPTTAQWLLTTSEGLPNDCPMTVTTSEGLPNDWPMTGPDCLTTTKRLPDECLTTAWQLPNNCPTTARWVRAWQLLHDYLKTAYDCLTTAQGLPDDCPMTDRQLSDECLMTAWWLHEDCPRTAWQLDDKYLQIPAMITNSSYCWNRSK